MEQPDPILNNLFSLYRSLGTANASAQVIPFGHYSLVKAKNSAWPNIAFGVDEVHFGPELIESIAREAAALQLRPTVILPYNETWVGLLKAQGFLPVDQWLGMSLSLADLTGDPADCEDDELIRIVAAEADIHPWTRVAAQILFPQQILDPVIFEFLRSQGAELIEIRVAGQPAGTAMIYFDETGTPGIYMVGIGPAYRGKGLGKKLMHFCCQRIVHKGGGRCCLQSTRMGLNLYRSLGFQGSDKYLIFCKIK